MSVELSATPLTRADGGHYAPQFAAYIHNQNVAIAAASALAPIPHKHIPLESVLIGNGLTEPYTQFATVPEFACAPSPTAIFDDATCTSIRSKVGTCQRLQQWCYNSPSRFTCTPAALYCWSNIVGESHLPGRELTEQVRSSRPGSTLTTSSAPRLRELA